MSLKKVLLVEDFIATRNVIAQMLRQMGFDEVLLAKDGMEAWQKLEHQKVDVVISDLELPELSGIDLLFRLRQQRRHSQPAFILISTRSDSNWIIEAVEKGATDYLRKPFDMEQLSRFLSIFM